jgi:endonuclease/exonuclease/phosphatase family metal-dependent hydrolase
MRQRIKQLADGRPVIVMGDLNVDEDDEAFQALAKSSDSSPGLELVDCYRRVNPQPTADEATFHGFHGGASGKRIDFVLTTDQFRATGAEIIRTSFDNAFPSDHFPVRVTLELTR